MIELQTRGQESLVPVRFNTEVVETEDRIEDNIRACLSRPYQSFSTVTANPFRSSCSIFGSGPSIDWTWTKAAGDIIACNAAHDFLIQRKTVPRWAMLWDPVEVIEELVTPHDEVTYLVASRCHPKVFKRLRNNKTVVWHAAGDECLPRLLEEHGKMEPMIMGGSAAAIRTMFLAAAMGYLDQHVFGMDGSYDGSSHIRNSVVREDEMEIHCLGRWFRTTAWLAVQAEDFKRVAPWLLTHGVRLTIYGDGLIPHIARAMGIPVVGNSAT